MLSVKILCCAQLFVVTWDEQQQLCYFRRNLAHDLMLARNRRQQR